MQSLSNNREDFRRMVDFNSENILVTDKSNLVSVMILEKVYYIIDSLEKYDRLKFSNASAPTYIVKASIKALYNTCMANLKNTDKTRYEAVLLLLAPLEDKKTEYNNFIKVWEILGDYLYSSGVIKFINKKKYDSSDPFDEMRAKGL